MLEVKQAFDAFGKYVVQQSRSNLTREKHRDTSKLYQSLDYNTIVYPSGAVAFTLSMEDYGEFVDQGVQGVLSSAKAPQSKFKFGTGTGKKGGLTEGIDRWVRSKRIQFRKPNGRFMTYDSTAFLIRKSIWLTGIKTTKFFSLPFERAYKRLPDEVLASYGIGVERLLKASLQNARQ